MNAHRVYLALDNAASPELQRWLVRHQSAFDRVVGTLEPRPERPLRKPPGTPEWALAAPPMAIYFSQGFPLPGIAIGKGLAVARGSKVGMAQYSTEELAARQWIQRHADDVREHLDAALALPANPTPAEVLEAFRRGRAAGAHLVLVMPDNYRWLSPGAGGFDAWGLFDPLRVGVYEPVIRRSWKGPQDEAGAVKVAISHVSAGGTRPYRIGIVMRSHSVSQGSGSWGAEDLFATSSSIQPPVEHTRATERRAVARSGKDAIIESLKDVGWSYSSGNANEYVTDPAENTRLQIKRTAVRLQTRDYRRGGWSDGTPLGSVKQVAEKLNVEKLQKLAARVASEAPTVEPTVSKAAATNALRAAGIYAYDEEINAYRYGAAARAAGLPEVVPVAFAGRTAQDAEFNERYIAAWKLGYARGAE